jgi:hypothetical protein
MTQAIIRTIARNIQALHVFTTLDSIKMSQNPIATAGLYIGIEAELLLIDRSDDDNEAPKLKLFAYAIAASYNEDAPDWVARMREEVEIEDVNDEEDERKFQEWVLTEDKSIETAYNSDDEDSGPRECKHLFDCHPVLVLYGDI